MFAVIIFYVIQAWQLDLVTAHLEIAVTLSIYNILTSKSVVMFQIGPR